MNWQDIGNSMNVKAAAYEGGALHIRFADGSEYSYAGVPQSLYDQLLNSPSPGSFVHKHLKGQFKHERR